MDKEEIQLKDLKLTFRFFVILSSTLFNVEPNIATFCLNLFNGFIYSLRNTSKPSHPHIHESF